MNSYSEAVVLHYMLQLSDALKWLHKRNLVHLDIKPENILVTTKMEMTTSEMSTSVSPMHNQQLKLIDFGDAFGTMTRNTVLTPSHLEFSAPGWYYKFSSIIYRW